jgi:hypothetical protein
MKELTSRKTGKPHYVSEEIYNQLVKKDQIRKYKVRDMKPLMTKAPVILKPELKPEVKKVTKSK